MKLYHCCFLVLVSLLAACDRPSADACRSALTHQQTLANEAQAAYEAESGLKVTNKDVFVTDDMVEDCRKNKTKKYVECLQKMKTTGDEMQCQY